MMECEDVPALDLINVNQVWNPENEWKFPYLLERSAKLQQFMFQYHYISRIIEIYGIYENKFVYDDKCWEYVLIRKSSNEYMFYNIVSSERQTIISKRK